MSDASEVKPQYLWFCQKSGWQVTSFDPNEDEVIGFSGRKDTRLFINKETHDRIIAERDELWKRATKFVMPGEMDTGESIEHYIKTLEQTVAELKAEVEVLKNHRAEYEADCKRIEYFDDLHEKVATQVRVIEKLKLQRGTILHEKYAGFPLLAMNAESDLDKELAAIEKEGAKDEPNQR